MSSVAYKVEKVPSPKSVLGEGPHWDAHSQSLYYVDIVGKEFSILRYDAKRNKTFGAQIEGESHVSFIIPVAGTTDQFAVGLRQGVGVIQWDGKSAKVNVLRTVFEFDQSDEFKQLVPNDAKADSTGRLYVGTLHASPMNTFEEIVEGRTPSALLYKFALNEKLVRLLDNVRISNGLAWNDQKNKFYFVDSIDWDIKEFDYDPATGDISNQRVAFDLMENGKRPRYIADGLTIDTQGKLYVAIFNGSKVLKVNPETGKVELEIQLPAPLVTSVTFGGPNLDVLYVTTATLIKDVAETVSEDNGRLFKITGLGVHGLDGVKVHV